MRELAESLVFTWEKLLTKQFGVIPGVTDRDYLTNSFHQPVWIHSSAIDKIDYEKEFHSIAKGGHISYAEFNYGVSPASLELLSTTLCAKACTLASMSSVLSAKNVANMGTSS